MYLLHYDGRSIKTLFLRSECVNSGIELDLRLERQDCEFEDVKFKDVEFKDVECKDVDCENF